MLRQYNQARQLSYLWFPRRIYFLMQFPPFNSGSFVQEAIFKNSNVIFRSSVVLQTDNA